MDRGLLTKAIIIGFVGFILAVGVLYYLSLMYEQAARQCQEMTSTVSNNSDSIRTIGLLMLVIVGFFALMIATGAVTALASAQFQDKWRDVFLASALAGGTPAMLLWVVFWCMTLANTIGSTLDHKPFGSDDLVFFGFFVLINVIMLGLGALIAGLAGHATRALVRGIAGQSA
jgi:hypothetical protein